MSKTKKIGNIKLAAGVAENDTNLRLRRLNKRLAIAYGLQALLLLAFASLQLYPVTIASHRLFDVSVSQLVALSLAISGAFHVLVASGTRQQYEAALKHRENPYRWLENAFSASLLPLAISLLVGLNDVTALAMLFTLGFVIHVLGWQFERQLAAGQMQDAKRSLVLIAVSGSTVWAAVGGYILYGLSTDGGLPAQAVAAYSVVLLASGSIGWVLLQFKRGRGKWREYLYVERTLALISFGTKSVVGWILLASVI